MTTSNILSVLVDNVVPFRSLVVMEVIGAGAFSVVHKVRHKDWGSQVFAYKKFVVNFISENSTEDKTLVISLKREAKIQRDLCHPNVVSMNGLVFEPCHYGLLLEYAVYGSLDKFLTTVKDHIDNAECTSVSWTLKIRMAHDVASAMSYLHTRVTPVIHGDLKIQNIIVAENIILKIADFGLSRWKDISTGYSIMNCSNTGTMTHIPPEKWTNPRQDADEKFDMYSFGILFWELLTETKPFSNYRDQIRSLVTAGERPPMTEIPTVIPSAVCDIIVTCWHQDPKERPSFVDLIKKLSRVAPEIQSEEAVKSMKNAILAFLPKDLKQIDHCQKMERACQPLSEVIRRTGRILALLFKNSAISSEEYFLIRSQSNPYELTKQLLAVLSHKPVKSYDCFLDALKTTNQEHLYYLLEEEGYHLNLDHQIVIKENFTFLLDNLQALNLLEHLLQASVLDDQEMDKIKNEGTRQEINNQLLDFIFRTSEQQYYLFLDALTKSKQHFIRETLQGGTVSKHFVGPVTVNVGLNTKLQKSTVSRYYSIEISSTEWAVLNRFQNLKLCRIDTTGQVCNAYDSESDIKVCITKLTRPFVSCMNAKRTFRMIKLLKQLRHENIIELLDVYTTANDLKDFEDVYTITNCFDVDLGSVLSSQKLSNAHIQFIIYQIVRALKYIHSAGIVHRDLKPSSIAVSEDCRVRIFDFSLARDTEVGMTGYVSTRWYRAPEIMLNWMHYNENVDIWSVGCIMAEMLTGKLLFPGENAISQLKMILELTGMPDKELLSKISKDAKQFIESLEQFPKQNFNSVFPNATHDAVDLLDKMLNVNPDRRITATQALAHPYLCEFADPEDEPTSEPYEEIHVAKDWDVIRWKEEVYKLIKDFVRRPVEVSDVE